VSAFYGKDRYFQCFLSNKEEYMTFIFHRSILPTILLLGIVGIVVVCGGMGSSHKWEKENAVLQSELKAEKSRNETLSKEAEEERSMSESQKQQESEPCQPVNSTELTASADGKIVTAIVEDSELIEQNPTLRVIQQVGSMVASCYDPKPMAEPEVDRDFETKSGLF